MSVTCPAGHVSATTDYCDQCGARIGPAAVAVDEPVRPDTSATRDTSATPVTAPCPRCGAARSGHDRFCEDCGFDLVAGIAPVDDGPDASPPAWAATVAADRDYFRRTAPEGLDFPEGEAPRTLALASERVRIGRRRSAGEERPELELGDPAVSRLHATLVRAGDGSWAVVDEGSSNGTTVNSDAAPIPPHVEVPLHEGDEVHLGAWTTITLALRSREA
jgi:FHA domain